MEMPKTDTLPGEPVTIKKPLSPKQQAELNRATAVHAHVMQQHGEPQNRAQRRVHESRVRAILSKLPPLV